MCNNLAFSFIGWLKMVYICRASRDENLDKEYHNARMIKIVSISEPLDVDWMIIDYKLHLKHSGISPDHLMRKGYLKFAKHPENLGFMICCTRSRFPAFPVRRFLLTVPKASHIFLELSKWSQGNCTTSQNWMKGLCNVRKMGAKRGSC